MLRNTEFLVTGDQRRRYISERGICLHSVDECSKCKVRKHEEWSKTNTPEPIGIIRETLPMRKPYILLIFLINEQQRVHHRNFINGSICSLYGIQICVAKPTDCGKNAILILNNNEFDILAVPKLDDSVAFEHRRQFFEELCRLIQLEPSDFQFPERCKSTKARLCVVRKCLMTDEPAEVMISDPLRYTKSTQSGQSKRPRMQPLDTWYDKRTTSEVLLRFPPQNTVDALLQLYQKVSADFMNLYKPVSTSQSWSCVQLNDDLNQQAQLLLNGSVGQDPLANVDVVEVPVAFNSEFLDLATGSSVFDWFPNLTGTYGDAAQVTLTMPDSGESISDEEETPEGAQTRDENDFGMDILDQISESMFEVAPKSPLTFDKFVPASQAEQSADEMISHVTTSSSETADDSTQQFDENAEQVVEQFLSLKSMTKTVGNNATFSRDQAEREDEDQMLQFFDLFLELQVQQ